MQTQSHQPPPEDSPSTPFHLRPLTPQQKDSLKELAVQPGYRLLLELLNAKFQTESYLAGTMLSAEHIAFTSEGGFELGQSKFNAKALEHARQAAELGIAKSVIERLMESEPVELFTVKQVVITEEAA